MREGTIDRAAPGGRPRRRWFGGTRGVLAVVALAALGLAWLAAEHREAGRRARLVAELGRAGAWSGLDEPTIVGQVVRKFGPGREAWLRARIGRGWFDHPSIFVAGHLDDARVPAVARRLRELGTVREVHYDGAGLTAGGIAALRADLPGVNVVPIAAPAEHREFLAAMRGPHLAYGALGFSIAVAVLALGLALGAIRWLIGRRRSARRAMAEP